MILLNKEEKEAVSNKFPNICITRTMRGDSKRHHYYCPEDKHVMRFLDNFRRQRVLEKYPVV